MTPSKTGRMPCGLEPSRRWIRRAALIALGLALLLAGYLGIRARQAQTLPGCGEGCEVVLSSQWSSVFGLPVVLPGALVYGALIILSLLPPHRVSRISRRLQRTLQWVVWLSAAWFLGLQMLVLRAFCPWCCTAHLLASAGAAGLRRGHGPEEEPFPWPPWIALSLILLLTAGQWLGPVRDDSRVVVLAPAGAMHDQLSPPEPGTQLELFDRRLVLSRADFPSLGSVHPLRTGLILFDYTCLHCREMHRNIEALLATPDLSDLAIVELPAARDREGVEIHRLLLSVWWKDPLLHRRLSGDLLSGRIPVNSVALRRVIEGLMGVEQLVQAMQDHDAAVKRALRSAAVARMELKAKTGSDGLPQVLLGNVVVLGAKPRDDLAAMLARDFRPPPPSVSTPIRPAPPHFSDQTPAPTPPSAAPTNLESGLVVTPSEVRFGARYIGEALAPFSVTVNVPVEGRMNDPMVISGPFNARWAKKNSHEPWLLLVEFAGPPLLGRHTGEIALTFTAAGGKTTLHSIPVSLTRVGEVYVAPAQLVLEAAELRGTARRALLIRPGKPGVRFKVTGVETPPAWKIAGVSTQVQPFGQDGSLMIHFTFPKMFDMYRGHMQTNQVIVITTDLSASAELVVPFSIHSDAKK